MRRSAHAASWCLPTRLLIMAGVACSLIILNMIVRASFHALKLVLRLSDAPLSQVFSIFSSSPWIPSKTLQVALPSPHGPKPRGPTLMEKPTESADAELERELAKLDASMGRVNGPSGPATRLDEVEGMGLPRKASITLGYAGGGPRSSPSCSLWDEVDATDSVRTPSLPMAGLLFPNVSGCCAACAADADCEAFVYAPDGHNCWLLAEVRAVRSNEKNRQLGLWLPRWPGVEPQAGHVEVDNHAAMRAQKEKLEKEKFSNPGMASNFTSHFPQTVIITCGCTSYQLWQSIVAVNSLKRMRQKHNGKFNILRVIACDSNKVWIPDQRLSDYYIGPEYTNYVKASAYAPLNKPGALNHWITVGPGRLLDESHEFVIVDSDTVFVGPIHYPLSQPGHPVGAHFSLGAFHQDPSIMALCRGEGCKDFVKPGFMAEHEVGPPYAFRKGDAVKLFKGWFDLSVEMISLFKGKHYYYDMWAYMFGAELYNLRNECRWGMFLVNENEIWHKIDYERFKNETFMFHYAGNFQLDEGDGYKMWWHKHQYKSNKTVETMLSCKAEDAKKFWSEGDAGPHHLSREGKAHVMPPPFRLPPYVNVSTETDAAMFTAQAPEVFKLRTRWIFWIMYNGIDEALKMHRETYCEGGKPIRYR